ncbi:MAG: hypothetical protein JWM99_952, partial [Verrucomicrobiales bacterium]|nr:hypothetical protein [Verrucomicrobiales bacterium]
MSLNAFSTARRPSDFRIAWGGCILRAIVASAALIGGLFNVCAQSTVSGRPCSGQSGFVVRDSMGRTISRGWTTTGGTLGDGLVLGANQTYSITVANGTTGTIGRGTFTTGNNGSTQELPTLQVGDSIDRDSDGDGVPDDIEDVFGTDPHNPSTYGNGIRDSVIATTPPPPGTPVGSSAAPGIPGGNSIFGPPGVISSVSLPGTCVDISAFNDIVALACLDSGVAVFNVFAGMTPRQIALVDTPGEARAVACAGDDIAVADGPRGLAIIDIRNPAAATVRAQVTLGSYAESVASIGGVAYVGLRNGQLVVVDIASATEVQRLNLNGEVFDVVGSGDFIWAVSGNNLRSFSSVDGVLSPSGNVALSSIGPDPFSGRKRLFVGGGIAEVACMSGFDDVDVRNPASMVVVGKVPANGPGSFKQIVSNGSGLGVACVGINPRSDGTHDVYLYDVGVPAKVMSLLTILPTPGIAYANTIYNGLDYVADGANGLEVVRYLETDRKGIAPVISLESNAASGTAEEGKLFRVTARSSDDVQVRNVEFYLDGNQIATDGNFPFEVFFNTPLSSANKLNFALRARAFDTGGNSTWSDPLTVNLGPDSTPPRVARTQPAGRSIVGQINSVIAFFSEPLRPDSLIPQSFQLVGAGVDGVIGTADDQSAPTGTLSYQESLKAAVWTFPAPLPPGLWQATIGSPIADRAGNEMQTPFRWTFSTFDQPDQDHDGVPDSLETLLGLDPTNPDSKGDGTRDGDRDFDNDGLSNAWEVFYGLDPRNAHTQNANILDGDLDPDGDGLINRLEQIAGTNPLKADSDNDGWNDEAEVSAGSDPLDPNSKPSMLVSARPLVRIGLTQFAFAENGAGLTVAFPPLKIGLPAFPDNLSGGL